MRKITYKHIHHLLLIFMTATLMLLWACEKEEVNPPVITEVRNYAPSPDDSIVQSLQPGQWVVLTGRNLANATQILFNGIPTAFNATMVTDNHAVVQVPEIIPFPLVSEEELNTIQYVTNQGLTIFSFDISAPAPTITRISNENANTGDLVTVFGTNLFLLTELSYAGTEITEYSSSPDGTFVSFILPELTGSGPVVAENNTGRYSTPFHVNDVSGVLCDFDDVNTFSWGASTSNSDPSFPGNRGYYAILQNDGLSAGNFNWWEGGRSINTNGVQWVPEDSLDDPIGDYAFKFEINVPGQWNGTSLFILREYDWSYVARYEPWKLGNDKTAPVSTSGNWITVTVPFSEFRNKPDGGKDGTGTPAESLKDVLGDSGSGAVNIFTVNDSNEAAAALNIAIDNIRVVKIR